MADSEATADQPAAASARASVKQASEAPSRPSVKPEAASAPPATTNQAPDVVPPRPSAAAVDPPVAEEAVSPRASAGNVAPPAETSASRASFAAVDPAQSNVVNEAEAELQRLRAMPVRQYLETTVVPLLLEGLQKLVVERPSDPVGFLVSFLSEHNPRRKSVKSSPAPAPIEGAQPLPPPSATGDPASAGEVRASIASPATDSTMAATERASIMGGTSAPPGASTEHKSSVASAAVPAPPAERISVSAVSASIAPTQNAADTAAPPAGPT